MKDTSSSPLLSIVMPSLDQGSFIREAIDSVLTQSYPCFELIVVDGGSSDDTLDILESYGDRLSWISEADSGQSDAINKGFRMAQGEIVAWLNSDDVYEQGAFEKAVEVFQTRPEVGLVYGNGGILDENSRLVGAFGEIEPFNIWRLLHHLDFVLQPATFYRRSALDEAGLLDEGLHYSMDWDLWIRLAACTEVEYLPETLAYSREYSRTKTATGGWTRIRELARLTRRHTGKSWTPGVRSYAKHTLTDTLKRVSPRFLHGLVDNMTAPLARHEHRLAAYGDGWLGPAGKIMVPSRWGGASLEFLAYRLPAGRALDLSISTVAGQHDALSIDRLGKFSHRVLFPREIREPFYEISVDSDFWFHTTDDPRRLSIICCHVGPPAAARSGSIGEA